MARKATQTLFTLDRPEHNPTPDDPHGGSDDLLPQEPLEPLQSQELADSQAEQDLEADLAATLGPRDGGWGDTRPGQPGAARPSFRASMRASFVTGRYEGDGSPPQQVARALDAWKVPPADAELRERVRAKFLAAADSDLERSAVPAGVTEGAGVRGTVTQVAPGSHTARARGERHSAVRPRRSGEGRSGEGRKLGRRLWGAAAVVSTLAAVFVALVVFGSGGDQGYEPGGLAFQAAPQVDLAEVAVDGQPVADFNQLVDRLRRGGLVTTGDAGVRLVVARDYVLEIGPHSEVRLPDPGQAGDVRLWAEKGALRIATGPEFAGSEQRSSRRLLISTPHIEAVAVGTVFGVDVIDGHSCVCCFEGSVATTSSLEGVDACEVAAGRTRIVWDGATAKNLKLVASHRAPLQALSTFW